MIIYFSATGNCKWVAEEIAKGTGETTYSIRESLKGKERTLTIGKGETLGFVTPTYFLQLPTVLTDWLDGTTFVLEGDNYVFTLATYGTTSGTVSNQLQTVLSKKGVRIDADYSLKVPDTWTPKFDLSDQEKNLKILESAKKDLETIIDKIKERATGDFNRAQLPAFTQKPAKFFYG